MSLFESAAADYARDRPGIPDKVVQLLTGYLDGVDQPVLLDLGAGTGQVPAALLPALPRWARMDLVDVDEGMLREASIRLPSVLPGGGTIAFHPMPAEEFTAPHIGYGAHLVTCARAFHWMDRAAVLKTADRVAAPHATVAIMGDGSLWTHESEWTSALRELVRTYLGPVRRAGTCGTYAAPGSSYEDDLAISPFSGVSEHRFPLVRAWTPETVVGYLRSTSFARPELFSDRHEAFEAEARHLLNVHARNGVLREEAVFTVLLARRLRSAA